MTGGRGGSHRRALSRALGTILISVVIASAGFAAFLLSEEGGETAIPEGNEIIAHQEAVERRPSPPPRPPKEFVVKAISKTEFRPDIIQIRVGDTVVWENPDSEPHTVTSSNLTSIGELHFNKLLLPGESYRFTFTEPGTYFYSCTIKYHGMQGIITVQ